MLWKLCPLYLSPLYEVDRGGRCQVDDNLCEPPALLHSGSLPAPPSPSSHPEQRSGDPRTFPVPPGFAQSPKERRDKRPRGDAGCIVVGLLNEGISSSHDFRGPKNNDGIASLAFVQSTSWE